MANPKNFLSESILLGAMTSLPVLMLLLIRYGTMGLSLGVALATFMSFFFINVIMEMSGQNAINHSDPKTLSDKAQEQLKKIDAVTQLTVFKGALIVMAIILVVMAFFTFDTGPGLGFILFESVIFGLAGSIPAVVASKNRGTPLNTNNIIVNHFLLFGFAHFIFQLGGFYTYK